MSTDGGPGARDEIGTEDATWKKPGEPSGPVEPFTEPPAPPRPGDVLFDRYRVERMLGAGGMGSVWLVRHLGLDAPRALKLIFSGVAFVPEAQARFRREARAMARLSHPNAVVVHDFQVAGGSAFIEMEYVRGRGLGDYLRAGVPMPIDWVARVLAQLCDVLQQAHDQGIVHRDLKPSNLMLLDERPPGQEWVKVLDFGIAKVLEPEASNVEMQTATGHFLGTAQYASPEQAMGWEVDGRSDVYALGVILYEMLTGYRPFDGPLQRQIYDHLNTPAPDFAERNPRAGTPAEVEALVLRCLAKRPDDRPASARALAEEFFLALQTSHGGPAPVPHATSAPAPTDRTQSPYWPYQPAAPTPGQGAGTVDDRAVPYQAQDLAPTQPTITPRRRTRWPAVVALVLGCAVLAAGIDVLGRKGRSPVAKRSALPDSYRAESSSDLVEGLPRVLVRSGDLPTRFLRVAGGEFEMGDVSGSEGDDDRPPHRVILSGYYLGETEVTNAEMEAYFRARQVGTKDRPRRWREAVDALEKAGHKPDKHPAVGIPHAMADDYARWFGGQLPTEAQWEFAARSGGKPIPYVWGAQRGRSQENANLNTLGASDVPTSEVGSYPRDRTEQGMLDMAGNVREWCRDRWAYYEPASSTARNPVREGGDGPFVVRGGSFQTFADAIRTTRPRRPRPDEDGSATADQVAQDGSAGDLGFRVAIEWPPSDG
jgi:serine/threonine-protein kinase